jgi:hypothetical protein
LFIGAVLLTLTAGFFAAVMIGSMLDEIRHWQDTAPQGTLEMLRRWLQIPLGILTTLAPISLAAGVWMRIIRRRNLINSLSEGTPYPFTPRSKYAAWHNKDRPAGRPAVFSGLRTRKRIGR